MGRVPLLPLSQQTRPVELSSAVSNDTGAERSTDC
jgi:hypothetical protein